MRVITRNGCAVNPRSSPVAYLGAVVGAEQHAPDGGATVISQESTPNAVHGLCQPRALMAYLYVANRPAAHRPVKSPQAQQYPSRLSVGRVIPA